MIIQVTAMKMMHDMLKGVEWIEIVHGMLKNYFKVIISNYYFKFLII